MLRTGCRVLLADRGNDEKHTSSRARSRRSRCFDYAPAQLAFARIGHAVGDLDGGGSGGAGLGRIGISGRSTGRYARAFDRRRGPLGGPLARSRATEGRARRYDRHFLSRWCARAPCEDEQDFVDAIIARGAALVPNVDWETSQFDRIRTISEFRVYRSANLFFIVSDEYEESPLLLKAHKGKPGYYVFQRNGGPTIDWFVPRRSTQNGKTKLTPGFVSHYPSYWSTRAEENLRAPRALKAFYRELCVHLRSGGQMLTMGPRGRLYLLCRHAASKYRTGSVDLPDSARPVPSELSPGRGGRGEVH